MQDVQAIDQVLAQYPVAPNPYTLLSKIPPEHSWVSVADLKDAFWARALDPDC